MMLQWEQSGLDVWRLLFLLLPSLSSLLSMAVAVLVGSPATVAVGSLPRAAAGLPNATVEWAEVDRRWVRMQGQHLWYYNALDSPHPPATGWKVFMQPSQIVAPVLRSWLDTEDCECYEEYKHVVRQIYWIAFGIEQC